MIKTNDKNKLYIIKGIDIINMTVDILNVMNPVKGKNKDMLIGIKPNLVCVSKPSDGAVTHPEIVEGIILYLRENGFGNIVVVESSWIGANTEDVADFAGYTELYQKYDIPFINVKEYGGKTYKTKGMKLSISEYLSNIDYLINVPLIKGHCQTDITCALKNMKGLIPDSEKRRYHQIGLHKPIAHLNTVIKQDLIIADAICPDPYFEEGGRPKQMDMIVGAFDPVLMDSYAAEVLGYNPTDIEYVKLAAQLGVGKLKDNSTEIINLGQGSETETVNQISKKYLNLINDNNACSACYSHLVIAMEKLHSEGLTNKFAKEICIGQGYKGQSGEIGIGDCTCEFQNHVKGCPPETDEMYKFLKTMIDEGKV